MKQNFLQLAWFEYLILFVLIFITLYYGFSSYALENMNEGLYAEIPREMLVTGNYLIPHLNFVPYLEKPPMLYWLIALSYHVFGVTTFAARLIPVTAGALICLIIFWFGRRLQLIREGWIAAIVLTTSIGFILISRVLIFDMVLTLFFVAALCCFYLWYLQERRRDLLLCYALMGCTFLTKGLVFVLIPAIALLFMLLTKTTKKKILRFISLPGILIFLLVVFPWVIAASIKQPHFAWDFFVNEQLMRFLNKRIPHDYHTGPIYYYILPLIIILMPWAVFIPNLFFKTKTANPNFKMFKIFLWTWFLVPFIFFSLSQAKAAYFIILSIPAAAFLIALALYELITANKEKYIFRICFILIIVTAFIFLFLSLLLFYPNYFGFIVSKLQLDFDYALPFLILCLTYLIFAMVGWILNFYLQKKYPFLGIVLIAVAITPLIIFFVYDRQRLQPQRSEILLAQYILTHDAKRPVYLYQDYEEISSILFYLQKRLPIIDTQSKDLYFGSHTPEAVGWFINAEQFKQVAQQNPVYVVLRNKKISQFKTSVPLQFCVVSQSGDVSVLSNKLKDC